jgi:glycosyltransferase involved in cell wall biosynthesis
MVGKLVFGFKIKSMSTRNKIILVVGTAELGGAEKQVVKLAGELVDSGHATEVWFLKGIGPLTEILDSQGIEWKDLKLNLQQMFEVTFFRHVILAIRNFLSNEIKIVHLFLPEAIIVGNLLILSRKIRIVSSSRGEIPFRNSFLEYCLKRALQRSNAVTVNSTNQGLELKTRFAVDPKKIHLTHNGVSEAIKFAEVSGTQVRCVYLANFYEYKNHHEMVLNICAQSKDINFVFVGDGPLLKATKDLVMNLGIQSQIEFVGSSKNPGIILETCQMAVHASITEGLSNAILEELSIGLPVIAFDVGGNSELIEDGKNGFLVPYSDWRLFSQRLNKLNSDVELRVRLSENAKQVTTKYSWTRSRDSFLKVYGSL